MLRQCVLLALSSDGSDIPLLAECGGRPALAWLLRECQRFGIEEFLLLTDDASGTVQHAARHVVAGLPRDARVTVVPAPANTGTGGALLYAHERLDARFLLCGDDVLFDANLAALVADRDPREAAVLSGQGLGEAVIGSFSRDVVQVLRSGTSLRHDALPQLQAAGTLRVIPADGWFGNLRDPAGLAEARLEAPRRLRRPALLLDRDGVLNVDHGYVGSHDRFEWMPGALDTIRLATQSGWHVFVVTNQSGVARGFYDEAAVAALLRWMEQQAHAAGGTIDDTRYCPYHEAAVVERYRQAHHWRKPQPGMLLDLIRAWELDPVRCVMVGDQPSDMQAAEAAGVTGHPFPGGNLLEFVRSLLPPRG